MENKIKFEPSKRTKRLYLGTRKQGMQYSSFKHHGLFETYNYDSDKTLFILAIVFETLCLFATIFLGYGASLSAIAFAIAIAFVAVALDIGAAIWHHYYTPKIHENILKRSFLDHNEIAFGNIKKQNSSWKLKKQFVGFIIVLMAFIKILIFYGAYGYINIILLAVIVSYSFVAYIHLYKTGYFLQALYLKLKIGKEYSRYLKTQAEDPYNAEYAATKVSHIFPFNGTLKTDILPDKYSLEEHNDGNYKITATGILYDSQLQNLIDKQETSEGKRIVVQEGLRFQFEHILQKEPR
jgi:hypothetical protein